jgi:antitoxin (DNA-binding transcriptional repressor) of toxin-antitoxin stability system
MIDVMTDERVTARELHEKTDEILSRVEEGHPVNLTRKGAVFAQIRPLTPEQAAIESAIAAGIIDHESLAKLPSVAEIAEMEQTPYPPGARTATEILLEMREEERY